MRLGFDLDGVLAELSIGLFRIADTLEKKEMEDVYRFTFRESRPLINPVDYLLFPDDEYIIITSRSKIASDITKKWIKKFCPHVKKVIILDHSLPHEVLGKKEIEDWLNEMARLKAEAINENKVEVYFDDSTYVVKKLRKLCPNTKIINYGGRI